MEKAQAKALGDPVKTGEELSKTQLKKRAEVALEQIDKHNIVELDEERKAAMVSNLLVVLCGEENAQPVLNTGSLYS